MLAHRLAWILTNGDPPTDKPNVLHRCDNRACCNPDHLFVGTQKQNIHDAVGKSRHPHGATHGMVRLTEELVRAVFSAIGTDTEIGLRFGISRTHASQIRLGKRWRHLGLVSA
jgi:hypothetical protein